MHWKESVQLNKRSGRGGCRIEWLSLVGCSTRWKPCCHNRTIPIFITTCVIFSSFNSCTFVYQSVHLSSKVQRWHWYSGSFGTRTRRSHWACAALHLALSCWLRHFFDASTNRLWVVFGNFWWMTLLQYTATVWVDSQVKHYQFVRRYSRDPMWSNRKLLGISCHVDALQWNLRICHMRYASCCVFLEKKHPVQYTPGHQGYIR